MPLFLFLLLLAGVCCTALAPSVVADDTVSVEVADRWTIPQYDITTIRWSPDGRHVWMLVDGGRLAVHDAETFEVVDYIPIGGMACFQLCDSGRTAVLLRDDTLRFLNTTTWETEREYRSDSLRWSVAKVAHIRSDGRMVLLLRRGTEPALLVWDPELQATVRTIRPEGEQVKWGVWSSDGTRLTVCSLLRSPRTPEKCRAMSSI